MSRAFYLKFFGLTNRNHKNADKSNDIQRAHDHFSFLPGDERFAIEPKIKNAKMNHIPALVATIKAKKRNITICAAAAALILTGNLPGYLPPRVRNHNAELFK